jgi:hypothetical protein
MTKTWYRMLSSGAANASEQQEAASEIRRLRKKLRDIRAGNEDQRKERSERR